MTSLTHATKHYDIFTILKGNRGKSHINETHLKQLIQSIKEKNLLYTKPITVNDKMVVIDGHHRLEAAKKLQTEIYYIVANNANYDDAIRLTRGVTDWSTAQYIECRAINGEPEYIKLKNFLDENKIDFFKLTRLANDGKRDRKLMVELKKGKFILNECHLKLVPYIKEIHKMLETMTIGGRLKGKTNLLEFWYGCYKFLSNPEVNLQRFQEEFKMNLSDFTEVLSEWKIVTNSLYMIYNKRLKKKLQIT